MPSAFSTALRVELISDNEQAGSWGQTTNRNFTQVFEEAITATTEVDVTAADATLTAINGGSDQSRRPYLKVTGAPVIGRTITAANVSKNYFVSNLTPQEITVKGAGQTGVVLPAGETSFVRLIKDAPAEQVRLAALGGNASFAKVLLEGTFDGTTPLLTVNQLGTGPAAKFQVSGVDVLTVDNELTTFAGAVAFPAMPGGGFLPLAGGVLTGNLREDRAASAEILLSVTDGSLDHKMALWSVTTANEMRIGYLSDSLANWKGGLLIKNDYKLYDILTGRPIVVETEFGGFLPIVGGTLTGNLALNAPTVSGNSAMFLRNFTGVNQGVLYWDAPSDGVILASYEGTGTNAFAWLRILSAGDPKNALQFNGNTVWHSGNMGAGSNLNADFLRGRYPTNANVGDTIVMRDGSGNFSAGTITCSNNLTVAGGRVYFPGGNFDAATAGNFWLNASIINLNGSTNARYNLTVAQDIYCSAQIVTPSYVYCYDMRGGWVGGANGGTIRTYNAGPNGMAFRWDGSSNILNIDNSFERGIETWNICDSRLKTNIRASVHDALATLRRLEVIEFDVEPEKAVALGLQRAEIKSTHHNRMAVMAQALEAVIPEAVYVLGDKEWNPLIPADVRSVRYTVLVPWLIRAVQQLAAKLDEVTA